MPMARPTWAQPMPQAESGKPPAARRRVSRPETVARIIQAASVRPSAACQRQASKAKGKTGPMDRAASACQRTRWNNSGRLSLPQRIQGAMPSSSSTGAIIGTNTALKYCGPTEILPRPKASRISGYRVPSSTVASAARSRTLPVSKAVSRDTMPKSPAAATCLIAPARLAKRISEAPIRRQRKTRMNRPRSGSSAKACTEDSTPERTRKVPTSESAKARSARKTVQTRRAPRRSVTTSEWTSAVPASQGNNEAFSLGSQNHQPPQPSS